MQSVTQSLTGKFVVFALCSLPAFSLPVGAQPIAPPKPASVAPLVVPKSLTNFHQVNDHIFRGAQPSPAGIRELAGLGIKTVLDLRESGGRSVAEKKAVEAAGMRYINIPLNGYHAPPDQVVTQILGLLDNPNNGTMFVHCRRGADRTGTVLACYRIAHDHWENPKALDEAKSFGMSWTEHSMQTYIVNYKARELTIGPAPAGPAQ